MKNKLNIDIIQATPETTPLFNFGELNIICLYDNTNPVKYDNNILKGRCRSILGKNYGIQLRYLNIKFRYKFIL
jgi:hypothetical protein